MTWGWVNDARMFIFGWTTPVEPQNSNFDFMGSLQISHLSFFFPTVLHVSHRSLWWMCGIPPGVLHSLCLGGDKTNTKSDKALYTSSAYTANFKPMLTSFEVRVAIHVRIADLFYMHVFIWFAKDKKRILGCGMLFSKTFSLFLYIQWPQKSWSKYLGT